MLKKKLSKPAQQQPAAPQLPDPATAPVIDLVIRYDGRTGQVGLTVIGGQVDFSGAYQLLDAARALVQKQEREALLGQAATPSVAVAGVGQAEG